MIAFVHKESLDYVTLEYLNKLISQGIFITGNTCMYNGKIYNISDIADSDDFEMIDTNETSLESIRERWRQREIERKKSGYYENNRV